MDGSRKFLCLPQRRSREILTGLEIADSKSCKVKYKAKLECFWENLKYSREKEEIGLISGSMRFKSTIITPLEDRTPVTCKLPLGQLLKCSTLHVTPT